MLSFKQFLSEEPDFAGTRGFQKAVEREQKKEEKKQQEDKFKEAQKAAKEGKISTTDNTTKQPSPLPTSTTTQPTASANQGSLSSRSDMLSSIKSGEPLKSSVSLASSDYIDSPILGSQSVRRNPSTMIKASPITTGLSIGSLGKYSTTYKIS